MNPKRKKEKRRRRAHKLADKAWDAADAGNRALAEKLIRRALAARRDNPLLWNDLGLLLLRGRKEDEAEQAFRNAVRLAPTFADAHARLAELLARRGWLEQAVAAQAQAVQHAPEAVEYAERLEELGALAADRAARTLADAGASAEETAAAPLAPAAELSAINWCGRLGALDWAAIGDRLLRDGIVLLPQLMDVVTSERLGGAFEDDSLVEPSAAEQQPQPEQSAVRRFREPIPAAVDGLRRAAYPHLARLANSWQDLLGETDRYSDDWQVFADGFRRMGQPPPAPFLLRLGPGGFRGPHRDVRGALFFPIRLAVVLSPRCEAAGAGFVGAEFYVSDLPERRKVRRREVTAGLGDGVLCCARDRLMAVGGVYGLQPVQHGIAPVTAGTCVVLGVALHTEEAAGFY
jgi:hypothetical protein